MGEMDENRNLSLEGMIGARQYGHIQEHVTVSVSIVYLLGLRVITGIAWNRNLREIDEMKKNDKIFKSLTAKLCC